MLRSIRLALTLLVVTMALAPHGALAWSERPAPTNPDGSSMFTDPDEALSHMTGRSEDGDQRRAGTFSTQQGNGSWNFSVTPQSSTSPSSPFNSMFGSPWMGQRR